METEILETVHLPNNLNNIGKAIKKYKWREIGWRFAQKVDQKIDSNSFLTSYLFEEQLNLTKTKILLKTNDKNHKFLQNVNMQEYFDGVFIDSNDPKELQEITSFYSKPDFVKFCFISDSKLLLENNKFGCDLKIGNESLIFRPTGII